MAGYDLQQSGGAALDLVVIAGSLGGVEALRTICAALPADFPAALAIVQHRSTRQPHLLAELLATWSTLPVGDATDGELVLGGRIYIAPPDRHMTVTASVRIALVDGPPIHHVRASAEPLFVSAALAYRTRLIAVVLTGGDGDGSIGIVSARNAGALTIAQDPDTAVCGDMPRRAIATGAVDLVLPLDAIADALVARVRESAARGRERPVSSP